MNRRLFLDIVERVGWTFLQGATSTLILADFLEVDAWKAAAVGGLAAVLAFVKGLAASRVGSPLSAATLPALPPSTSVVVGQVLGPVGEKVGEVTSETGDLVGAAGAVVGPVVDEEGEPLGEVIGPAGEADDKGDHT